METNERKKSLSKTTIKTIVIFVLVVLSIAFVLLRVHWRTNSTMFPALIDQAYDCPRFTTILNAAGEDVTEEFLEYVKPWYNWGNYLAIWNYVEENDLHIITSRAPDIY